MSSSTLMIYIATNNMSNLVCQIRTFNMLVFLSRQSETWWKDVLWVREESIESWCHSRSGVEPTFSLFSKIIIHGSWWKEIWHIWETDIYECVCVKVQFVCVISQLQLRCVSLILLHLYHFVTYFYNIGFNDLKQVQNESSTFTAYSA